MTEEVLRKAAWAVEKELKDTLADHHLGQKEAARLMNVNPMQLNRAIKGDMTPKSVELRRELREFLSYL